MLPLKPCCSVGAWPDHEAVNADIRAQRLGIRQIAAKYGVKKGIIEKHKRCLDVKGGPVNGAASRVEAVEPDEVLPGEEVPVEVTHTTKDSDVDSEELPSVEIVLAPKDNVGTHAGARVFRNPKDLQTRHERREYVADLVANGQWHGRRTARRLQTVWSYSDVASVWQIRSEAQSILDAHRGPLLEQRAETSERLRGLGRMAKRMGDVRAATVAEVEAAKIDGIHNNGKPVDSSQADQRATAFWQRMLARLERDGHVEALASMQDEANLIAAEANAK